MDGHLFQRAEPARKGLGLVQGGRQKDELDRRIQKNHGLLPDLAPIGVVDVVALVKDDGAEALEAEGGREAEPLRLRALLVQKVAQNLRRHDDDLGVGAELDVARHDADRVVLELGSEVVVFLVGEGLDGGRVKDPFALGQAMVDLVFAHEGLARARLGTDKDMVALVNGRNGVLLEGVQGERIGECRRVEVCGDGLGQIGLDESGIHLSG